MLTDDQIVNELMPDDPLAAGEEQTGQPAPYAYEEHFWLKFPLYSKEFAREVIERFSDHLEWFENSNVGNAVWAAYRAYHSLEGVQHDGVSDPIVSITEAGEDGEFLSMRINHYRGLLKHQVALVTANRPAWDPQARTTDSEATRQVTLARNLMDYLMDVKRIGLKVKTQFEIAKVCASGFLALGWNERVGLKGSGTAWALPLAPWEVAHERVRVYDDATWWIFRAYESRWEWVAKFAKDDPEKAEKIKGLECKKRIGDAFLYDDPNAIDSADTDRIEVLYLYAKPTAACPEGRVAVVADEDLVLLDGPNPYGDECPIERICPAEFVGTSIPFGDSWVLLAPDEAYNAILSMCMTRVDTHGVPSIAVPMGSEYKPSDFWGNGMVEVPPGSQSPEILDFMKIPNEMPHMMELIKAGMEQLSGINSVTRGQPQENVTSGSFAALLQSMAIQFNSSDEEAWISNLERVGTHLLRIYQRMASEEQLISICGSDEMWSARDFKGEDLDRIQRIAIKTTNALQKTQAGKMAIADSLLERGLIQSPQEYIQVLNTGNVEPLFSGPARELALIKSENEKMLRGEPPKVGVWDNDQLHIREHKCLLDTQMRDDAKAAALVMAHLQEHMTNWQTKTLQAPDILEAIGQPPLSQAMAIAQQAQAMEGVAPPPGQPGPRQQQQPGTEPARGKPGPSGQPRGQEPGPLPSQPKPAKTPDGEPVV